MKQIFLIIFCIFSILFTTNSSFSQDYPYEIYKYPFVKYDTSRIEFYGDTANFVHFYQKLDKLILAGEGQINIIHIGGSHIQPDILTGRMRERFQSFYPGIRGGRGFLFPYKIANTNNPRNFSVDYSDTWESCRNVELNKTDILGLSGIAVSTTDTSAYITIGLNRDNYYDYQFHKIKIFHNTDGSNFSVLLGTEKIQPVFVNEKLGYSLFILKESQDTLHLTFHKENEMQTRFELFGISLEADDAGVYYHNIGVNGASIPSYLRCQKFVEHMTALQPDLVILSLGTNDAYTSNFLPEVYHSNYDTLLNKIHSAAPQAAILMTVANDSYLFRRKANPNTTLCAEEIKKLSKEHNAAMWNFYEVMGGLNSVVLWNEAGLAADDRIHFTGAGYLHQADLLFNALMKSYDIYLENKRKTN